MAEKEIKGNSNKNFLVSTYLCHPSMANNELSGPLVLLGLYSKISSWEKRNFNYKFLINPETIGSLSYLYKFKNKLKKNLSGGLVLTCLGGPKKKLSFKKSRNEDSSINKFIKLFHKKNLCEVRDYTPLTGSDERQYCSPGFDLPVGQVARTVYLKYKEYHTSLDNKKFLNIKNILKSIENIEYFLKIFDQLNIKISRYNKYGEIFLTKHNLHKDKKSNDLTKTIIYLLSCKENELVIDIVSKYNLDFDVTIKAINILNKKKIIKINI